MFTFTKVTPLLVLSTLLFQATAVHADSEKDSTKASAEKKNDDKQGWKPLFNGKDLEGWKVTNFGGEGEVLVEKGEVVITQGVDLSGITSTSKKLPKSNYEIEFEAQREDGNDFFVGLTFPVKEDPCSLIVGGWGGGVCGLSSLDGMDASENDTTSYSSFTRGQWYKVRLQVTDDRIKAWLDKQELLNIETKYHKIGIRYEVELSKPLGFATYQTTARIRNARIRQLTAEDLKKAEEDE